MKTVQIPKSVISIGDEAFQSCFKMEMLIIPDSIQTIGNLAFSWCQFSSIKIPRSVISFGINPFTRCNLLREIDVSENPSLTFSSGVLMGDDMTQIIYYNPLRS